MELTAQELRGLLAYDPETGVFTWRVHRGRAAAGAQAGKVKPDGSIVIGIRGRHYRAHRLAWLYVTGEWPAAEIDHRDLNPADNRWANLREATRAQNAQNRPSPPTNTSGLKGASWHKGARKWDARIMVRGKCHYLGLFDTAEAAHAAYVAAAIEHHGEFARTTT